MITVLFRSKTEKDFSRRLKHIADQKELFSSLETMSSESSETETDSDSESASSDDDDDDDGAKHKGSPHVGKRRRKNRPGAPGSNPG